MYYMEGLNENENHKYYEQINGISNLTNVDTAQMIFETGFEEMIGEEQNERHMNGIKESLENVQYSISVIHKKIANGDTVEYVLKEIKYLKEEVEYIIEESESFMSEQQEREE